MSLSPSAAEEAWGGVQFIPAQAGTQSTPWLQHSPVLLCQPSIPGTWLQRRRGGRAASSEPRVIFAALRALPRVPVSLCYV